MSRSTLQRRVYSFAFASGVLIALTQFQNCAPEGAFEAASINIPSVNDLGSFEDLEHDHDTSIYKAQPITTFTPPLMDRQGVRSILENAFGPSWNIETSNIETRIVEFGKGCSMYQEYNTKVGASTVVGLDGEVCRMNSAQYNLGLESTANPMRASYLLSACSELSNNSTTLSYFMNKVGSVSERNTFNNETLIRAYEAFYVGKSNPSQAAIDSLKIIGQSQNSSQKAWSAIAFSLCASGQWQVL